jgi:hypothetical protein
MVYYSRRSLDGASCSIYSFPESVFEYDRLVYACFHLSFLFSRPLCATAHRGPVVEILWLEEF